MKNLFKSILFAAAAAAAFTSCSNADDSLAPDGGDNGVHVNFLAGVDGEDGTRAAIIVGDKTFSGNWEATDQLGVYYKTPAAANGYSAFTYDESSKSFGGTLSSVENGNWTYYAYYPHVEGTTGAAAAVPFGGNRQQSGNGYNSAYDVMVAGEVECAMSDPGKTPEGDPVKFKLSRLTSILCFSLNSIDPVVAGAKVKSVQITAETPLSAKSLDFDYTKSMIAVQLNAAAQSKSILLNYAPGTEPSVADFKAFFNILPGNYNLKVEVLTDNNKKATFNVDRTDVSKPFEAGKLYTKTQALTGWTSFAVPTSVWEGHDWATRYELVEGLLVKVIVAAEAGIAKFEIDITSKPLTEPQGEGNPSLLEAVGLAAHMDLVNPANEQMATMLQNLQFPIGDAVRNLSALDLDITSLMSMLYMVCESVKEDGDHDFKLTVIDNAGQTVANTVQLKYIAPKQIVYAKDADLWKNTASFNITPLAAAQNVLVEYKRSTETTWQQATVAANGDGTFKASIAPTWATTTNDATLTIANVNRNTGVFANATYDVRLTLDGTEAETIQFSTAKGDVIPGGDMEDSSMSCWGLDNSNASFWASGNNNYFNLSYLKELCNQEAYTGMGGLRCAKLANQYAIIMLAAGNLFTGTFVKPSTQGTVSFGQPYTYTARPTAMKVKYHSTLGKIDATKWPGDGVPVKNDPDQARIFVAIVDWSARHDVSSGTAAPSGMWDPCKVSSLAAGNIIGYGSLTVPSSTEGSSMVEATLDIHYYDNVTKPTGQYSIVISCSASAFGDYMVGYKKSIMRVDDFEWVY